MIIDGPNGERITLDENGNVTSVEGGYKYVEGGTVSPTTGSQQTPFPTYAPVGGTSGGSGVNSGLPGRVLVPGSKTGLYASAADFGYDPNKFWLGNDGTIYTRSADMVYNGVTYPGELQAVTQVDFATYLSRMEPTTSNNEVPIMPTAKPKTGYHWELNNKNQWVEQPGVLPGGSQVAPPGNNPSYTDKDGNIWGWDTENGGYTVNWGYDPLKDTSKTSGGSDPDAAARLAWDRENAGAQRLWEEQQAEKDRQFQLQEQAKQIEEQRQQRLATLAAQPKSWLEYAALSGKQAVIQPWMKGLNPDQNKTMNAGDALWYNQGASNVNPSGGLDPTGLAAQGGPYIQQTNQTNPNYSETNLGNGLMQGTYTNPGAGPIQQQLVSSTTGQTPIQGSGQMPDYTNLTQLATPGTQYWARMGPTAQAQLGGYEQARTGETPENLDWRLWGMAPPTGQNPTLNYAR
jgi:hypothetical protein